MGRDEKVNWIMGRDDLYMKKLWYELVVNGVACNHEFFVDFFMICEFKTCTCISSSFASFGTFQYINHIHVHVNESSL